MHPIRFLCFMFFSESVQFNTFPQRRKNNRWRIVHGYRSSDFLCFA